MDGQGTAGLGNLVSAVVASAGSTLSGTVSTSVPASSMSAAPTGHAHSRAFPTPRVASLASSLLDPLLSLVSSITNTHLVLFNNIEALYILLDCGYVRAVMLATGGHLARMVVERVGLSVVGL